MLTLNHILRRGKVQIFYFSGLLFATCSPIVTFNVALVLKNHSPNCGMLTKRDPTNGLTLASLAYSLFLARTNDFPMDGEAWPASLPSLRLAVGILRCQFVSILVGMFGTLPVLEQKMSPLSLSQLL